MDRDCPCPEEAHHAPNCPATPGYAATCDDVGTPTPGWGPALYETWFPACGDAIVPHMWMYCPDCERRFGEINGSLTGHVCVHLYADLAATLYVPT